MKIFVDENVPLITVSELREQGFDVIDIRGTDDQGITDENLWQKVQNEKCLLITTDKGFSSHRDEVHLRNSDYPPQTAYPVKNSSTRYAVNKKIFRKRMVWTHGCYA